MAPADRPTDPAGVRPAVPVLRVADGEAARAFYVDVLGFVLAWEHRFEPGLPLYQRLVRGACELDLSEHHGDGTPGSVVWVPVDDLATLHAEVRAATTRMRPGIDRDAPGGPTMEVVDPSGNTLRFCQVED